MSAAIQAYYYCHETVKTDMAEHTGAITGEFFSVGGPVRRSTGQWPATARKHPDSILQDQLVFADSSKHQSKCSVFKKEWSEVECFNSTLYIFKQHFLPNC